MPLLNASNASSSLSKVSIIPCSETFAPSPIAVSCDERSLLKTTHSKSETRKCHAFSAHFYFMSGLNTYMTILISSEMSAVFATLLVPSNISQYHI